MIGAKLTVAFAAAFLVLGAVAAVNGDAANDVASLARLAEGERFRFVHWNIGHFALGLAPATSIEAKDSAVRSAAYRSQIERLHPDFFGVSEFEPVFDKAGRLATTTGNSATIASSDATSS